MIEIAIPVLWLGRTVIAIGIITSLCFGPVLCIASRNQNNQMLLPAGILLLFIGVVLWFASTAEIVYGDGLTRQPLFPELMSPADVWNMLMSWVSAIKSMIPVSVKFV